MRPIRYSSTATRQLAVLSKKVREAVIAKIHRYAETGAGDVKALQGVKALRLRVGYYRVVFSQTAEDITILEVTHRRDIYR